MIGCRRPGGCYSAYCPARSATASARLSVNRVQPPANSPNTRPAATRHRSAARPASAPAAPGQSSALLRLPGDDAHRRLRLPRRRIPICEGWRRHAVSRDSCPARAARRHSRRRGTHVSENSEFRGLLPTWSGRSCLPSAFAIRRITLEYDSPGPRSRPRRSTVRRSRTTNSPPLPTDRASAFEPLDSVASIAAKASRVIEIVTMRHYGLRHARPAISPLMCNLYSLTKGQAAIREWFRARHDRTRNLPLFPGIFPDQLAPIVRNGADRERELLLARGGMPGPPQYGGAPVTNIRNVSSPHWRGWLGKHNRCLVPATSFCEYADTKPRKTPRRQP